MSTIYQNRYQSFTSLNFDSDFDSDLEDFNVEEIIQQELTTLLNKNSGDDFRVDDTDVGNQGGQRPSEPTGLGGDDKSGNYVDELESVDTTTSTITSLNLLRSIHESRATEVTRLQRYLLHDSTQTDKNDDDGFESLVDWRRKSGDKVTGVNGVEVIQGREVEVGLGVLYDVVVGDGFGENEMSEGAEDGTVEGKIRLVRNIVDFDTVSVDNGGAKVEVVDEEMARRFDMGEDKIRQYEELSAQESRFLEVLREEEKRIRLEYEETINSQTIQTTANNDQCIQLQQHPLIHEGTTYATIPPIANPPGQTISPDNTTDTPIPNSIIPSTTQPDESIEPHEPQQQRFLQELASAVYSLETQIAKEQSTQTTLNSSISSYQSHKSVLTQHLNEINKQRSAVEVSFQTVSLELEKSEEMVQHETKKSETNLLLYEELYTQLTKLNQNLECEVKTCYQRVENGKCDIEKLKLTEIKLNEELKRQYSEIEMVEIEVTRELERRTNLKSRMVEQETRMKEEQEERERKEKLVRVVVKFQGLCRGVLVRADVTKKRNAVRVIQTYYKRYKNRLHSRQISEKLAIQEQMCLRIQKTWRGYRVRKVMKEIRSRKSKRLRQHTNSTSIKNEIEPDDIEELIGFDMTEILSFDEDRLNRFDEELKSFLYCDEQKHTQHTSVLPKIAEPPTSTSISTFEPPESTDDTQTSVPSDVMSHMNQNVEESEESESEQSWPETPYHTHFRKHQKRVQSLHRKILQREKMMDPVNRYRKFKQIYQRQRQRQFNRSRSTPTPDSDSNSTFPHDQGVEFTMSNSPRDTSRRDRDIKYEWDLDSNDQGLTTSGETVVPRDGFGKNQKSRGGVSLPRLVNPTHQNHCTKVSKLAYLFCCVFCLFDLPQPN